MMVVLEHHPNHTDLDMDKITLKDVSCTLNDLGEFNATHLWMKAPLDGCMTEHNTTEDTITYLNSIVAETRASAGSVLISREFQAEFPFKCSYPRSAIMSVASFSPREKVIYTRTGKREVWVLFLPGSSAARLTSTVSRLLSFLQGSHDQTIRQIQEGQDSEIFKLNRILNVFFFLSAAQFGNFTFTMDMYETDQYLKPYDSYPVKKNLQEKMYLEVKVTSNDSKLVLIPERCWATPSDDPNDGKFFAFIEKG